MRKKKTWVKNLMAYLKTVDLWMLLLCAVCSGISVLCQYGIYRAGYTATSRPFLMQTVMSVGGIFAAFVISNIDYHLMCKLWKAHLPLSYLLVILTFFIGIAPEGTDDRAWLDFGFTTLQPSELLKLSFILTFAMHLSYVKDDIKNIKTLFFLCLHGVLPIFTIVLQGDLGTAIVFLMIFLVMIYAAGLPSYYILGGAGVLAVGVPIFWHFFLPDYLKSRFAIAFHPELDPLGDGYQQYLGKIALGSGQLVGRGLFNEDMYSVPECYNDFVFSFIGQVFGFVGCVAVILLLVSICMKMLFTGMRAKDPMGCYICIGVFAIFFTQIVINILMVLCLMPVIGITLPLFSAGGTSVLVCYIAIGMVMSVYRFSKNSLLYR